MRLSVIAVVAQNSVIGRDGDLPWKLSADLQRFKRITMGHTMVMGRKTYDSVGRALPGRRSIVLTRSPEFRAEGVEVVGSWPEAMELAQGDDEVFVIGGASLYELGLREADRLYLTHVEAEVEGDVLFPDWDSQEWRVVEEERFEPDQRNEYATTFRVWERRS